MHDLHGEPQPWIRRSGSRADYDARLCPWDCCSPLNRLVVAEAHRSGFDSLQYLNHHFGGATSVYEVVDTRQPSAQQVTTCAPPAIEGHFFSGWGGNRPCHCDAAGAAYAGMRCTAMNATLRLLVTGDVHGFVDPAGSRLAYIAESSRRRATAKGHGLLLLDAGDAFVGSDFFAQHRTLGVAEFMRKIGYQAMALGCVHLRTSSARQCTR